MEYLPVTRRSPVRGSKRTVAPSVGSPTRVDCAAVALSSTPPGGQSRLDDGAVQPTKTSCRAPSTATSTAPAGRTRPGTTTPRSTCPATEPSVNVTWSNAEPFQVIVACETPLL